MIRSVANTHILATCTEITGHGTRFIPVGSQMLQTAMHERLIEKRDGLIKARSTGLSSVSGLVSYYRYLGTSGDVGNRVRLGSLLQ